MEGSNVVEIIIGRVYVVMEDLRFTSDDGIVPDINGTFLMLTQELQLYSVQYNMDNGNHILKFKKFISGGLVSEFHWPELTMVEFSNAVKNDYIRLV